MCNRLGNQFCIETYEDLSSDKPPHFITRLSVIATSSAYNISVSIPFQSATLGSNFTSDSADPPFIPYSHTYGRFGAKE